MSKKTIIFTIDDGKVTCETSGFTGAACEAATKEFTEALGTSVSNVKKPEYHQRPQVGTGKSISAGGGAS